MLRRARRRARAIARVKRPGLYCSRSAEVNVNLNLQGCFQAPAQWVTKAAFHVRTGAGVHGICFKKNMQQQKVIIEINTLFYYKITADITSTTI